MADVQPIALDTPLETDTENTVVPISQPTLLFNPQAKYNNMLSNSIKYEGDGWFIDWKHIELKKGGTGAAMLYPDDQELHIDTFGKNDNMYTFVFTNGFTFSVSRVSVSDNCTLYRASGSDIINVDIVVNGTSYTLQFDARTGNLISNGGVTDPMTVNYADGIVEGTVSLGANPNSILEYKYPSCTSDVLLPDQTYVWDGTNSTWCSLFKYNGSTLSSTNTAYTNFNITSNVNGLINASFEERRILSLAYKWQLKDEMLSLAFTKVQKVVNVVQGHEGTKSAYGDQNVSEPYWNDLRVTLLRDCQFGYQATEDPVISVTGVYSEDVVKTENNVTTDTNGNEVIDGTSYREWEYEIHGIINFSGDLMAWNDKNNLDPNNAPSNPLMHLGVVAGIGSNSPSFPPVYPPNPAPANDFVPASTTSYGSMCPFSVKFKVVQKTVEIEDPASTSNPKAKIWVWDYLREYEGPINTGALDYAAYKKGIRPIQTEMINVYIMNGTVAGTIAGAPPFLFFSFNIILYDEFPPLTDPATLPTKGTPVTFQMPTKLKVKESKIGVITYRNKRADANQPGGYYYDTNFYEPPKLCVSANYAADYGDHYSNMSWHYYNFLYNEKSWIEFDIVVTDILNDKVEIKNIEHEPGKLWCIVDVNVAGLTTATSGSGSDRMTNISYTLNPFIAMYNNVAVSDALQGELYYKVYIGSSVTGKADSVVPNTVPIEQVYGAAQLTFLGYWEQNGKKNYWWNTIIIKYPGGKQLTIHRLKIQKQLLGVADLYTYDYVGINFTQLGPPTYGGAVDLGSANNYTQEWSQLFYEILQHMCELQTFGVVSNNTSFNPTGVSKMMDAGLDITDGTSVITVTTATADTIASMTVKWLTPSGGNQRINIGTASNVNFKFSLTDPFLHNYDVTIISKTATQIQFMYKGFTYTITLDPNATDKIQWLSTDIRNMSQRVLLEQSSINEYTVCESFWCDENQKEVWVVDQETLIVLHYTDEISLWKKTEWTTADAPYDKRILRQAFKWTKTQSIKATQWDLGIRYGISSAIDNRPYVWSLSYGTGKLILTYAEAQPNTLALTWKVVNIPVSGTPSANALGQLDPVESVEEIYNQSRLSATRKGNELWFGIAFDKVLKQWTVKINNTSVSRVVNGYGHVGLDGTLTGGMVPLYAVDTNGIKVPITLATKIDLDATGIYYNKGVVTYLSDFESVCIAIEGGSTLVTVPFINKKSIFKNKDTKDKTSANHSAGVAMGSVNLVGHTTNGSCSSWLFLECFASGWATFMPKREEVAMKLVYDDSGEYSYMWESLDGNEENIVLVAKTLSGGGAPSVPPTGTGDQAYSGIISAGLNAVSIFGSSISPVASQAGSHIVYIYASDLFSVSQESAIRAGPGFVQIQAVKQASLCASGLYDSKKEEVGVFVDPLTYLTIPGIQVGFANGVNGYTQPFGNPVLVGMDSGVSASFYGRSMPYRRYGYNHRYIDYPLQNSITHTVKDLTAIIKKRGADKYDMPESSVTQSDYKIFTGTGRYSLVEGSIIPGDILTNSKRSTKEVSPCEFSAAYVYDYCIKPSHELWVSAIDGEIVCVSIRDTKVLDGVPSNIVLKGQDILIGSCYTALEILHPSKYAIKRLRPRAVTPQTLLIPQTGINCIHGDRIYHACDAYFNRIEKNTGDTGYDIEVLNSVSTYRADDDFKVSTIAPPAAYFGKFTEPFSYRYKWLVEQYSQFYKSLKAEVEEPNAYRYSIPIIYNRLAILPAVAKTIAAYKLDVIEGVTALTTQLRNTLDLSRRPDALDFAIYGQVYRWNPEYISEIKQAMGVLDIKDLVATIGLTYIGSTPDAAWFHSAAIRAFYTFAPSTVQRKMNADLYKNVTTGAYDYVSQEVLFNPLTYRGDELVRMYGDKVIGNLYIPLETIGPYDFYSMAGGVTLQGLWRFQVNRFLATDDMVMHIVANKGKWGKLKHSSIKDFWKHRDYGWQMNPQNPYSPAIAISRWFHEPFKYATSLLGQADNQECKFEWELNFQLTDIINTIWNGNYATVYLAAETMTVGGVVESEVSYIRLHKRMFAHSGQRGYYSYRFNANNGIGDSERLYIWSDAPIAVRAVCVGGASITTKRASITEDFNDTKGMKEF